MSRLARAFALAGALLLTLTPATAFAHAQLVISDPPDGAVLETPPTQLVLTFDEPLERSGWGATLYSPRGSRVPVHVQLNGDQLVVRLTSGPAGEGTYVAIWHVLSLDTHPTGGTLTFSVSHRSANPALATASILPGSAWATAAETAARWLHVAGLVLTLGVLLAMSARGEEDRRLRRLIGSGVVVLLAAEPLTYGSEVLALSPDPTIALTLVTLPFGQLVVVRALLDVFLWLVVSQWSRGASLLICLGIVLVDGQLAHRLAQVPEGGELLDAAHLAATSAWAGGSVVFAFGRDRADHRVVQAGLAGAVLTGGALALLHVGVDSHALLTPYGSALAAKTLLVLAAVVVIALRYRRVVLVLLALTIGGGALLTSLAPPR